MDWGVILLSGANFTAYSAFSNNATTYLRNSLGLSAAVAGGIYSLQGIGAINRLQHMGIHFRQVRGGKTSDWDGAQRCVCIPLYEAGGREYYPASSWYRYFWGLRSAFPVPGAPIIRSCSRRNSAPCPPESHLTGGRIISTFAIPAIAGLGSAAAGMQGIFMVSMAVFVAGAVIWMFLPETYQKNEKAADNE